MHKVSCIKGVGDGVTSEARALPLSDSSSLNQSSNEKNQKLYYNIAECLFSVFNKFIRIAFKCDHHTHQIV